MTGVLIPYTVWSIIYIYLNKKYTNPGDLLIQILSGNACYHLWYMGMIIRLFIYFPIILLIAKKVHKQKFIVRILVFITLIISYYQVSKYQNVISNKIVGFLFTNPTKLQGRIINISPLFWYLYFVIGIYIALNYKTFKEKILKFKIPVLFFYLALFIYAYLNEMNFIKFNRSLSLSYFVFSILAGYILSVKLSNNISLYSILNFISKYSFGAYLCHILVIGRVVNKVRWMFNLKDWLAVGLITWITSSILSTCLIKLINLVPYTKFITGIKHKKIIINYDIFEKINFINKS
ncbi:acyltransferase family protein [Clostridium tetani]|uniref:acyltransferase family protein n=1 Tax=Clostridium tetani TaxID=1513 RepID=UPI0039C8A861